MRHFVGFTSNAEELRWFGVKEKRCNLRIGGDEELASLIADGRCSVWAALTVEAFACAFPLKDSTISYPTSSQPSRRIGTPTWR